MHGMILVLLLRYLVFNCTGASPGPALATTGPPSYSEVIKHQQQQPGAHPVQQATYPLQQGAYPPQQGMYPPQQNVYLHQLGAAPVQPVQAQSAHQSLGTRLVYTEHELTRPDFAKRNRVQFYNAFLSRHNEKNIITTHIYTKYVNVYAIRVSLHTSELNYCLLSITSHTTI